LSGNSTDGAGVVLGTDFTLDGGGTVNVTGRSVNDVGVAMNGTTVQGSTMNVNGTSTNRDGVDVTGAVSASDGGVLNINGNGATAGVHISGSIDADNGTINVNSTASGANDGFALTGAANASNGGAINIDGTSQDGTGANLTGSVTVDATSTFKVVGTSNSGDGVAMDLGGVDVAGGTLTVIGISNGAGTGANIAGTAGYVLSDGDVTFNGTSNSGIGLSFGATDYVVNGTGSLTLVGATNGSSTVALPLSATPTLDPLVAPSRVKAPVPLTT
jgi:hypothetical protein